MKTCNKRIRICSVFPVGTLIHTVGDFSQGFANIANDTTAIVGCVNLTVVDTVLNDSQLSIAIADNTASIGICLFLAVHNRNFTVIDTVRQLHRLAVVSNNAGSTRLFVGAVERDISIVDAVGQCGKIMVDTGDKAGSVLINGIGLVGLTHVDGTFMVQFLRVIKRE